MPKQMGDIVSDTFYSGQLQSFKKASQQSSCLFLDFRARWYKRDMLRYSPHEGKQALRIVRGLTKKYPQNEVLVLTFYYSQVEYFRHLCKEASDSVECSCSTVDGYQGKESDFVILLTCCYGVKKPPKFICNLKKETLHRVGQGWDY